jgi:hypothetical protein
VAAEVKEEKAVFTAPPLILFTPYYVARQFFTTFASRVSHLARICINQHLNHLYQFCLIPVTGSSLTSAILIRRETCS